MISQSDTWAPIEWKAIYQIIDSSKYDYRDDFVGWLNLNPAVWHTFAGKALDANRHKHRQRFSAKAIIEVIRWETMISEADVTFKINNNFAPDLARLIMDVKPELKGYFQIRGSETRKDAPL